jgi:electron transfer flavoprotein beta subunit
VKVLVPIKRVVDYSVRLRMKDDGSGPDLAGVRMSMNPFDEIALEAAIRLKEQGKATDVFAVSVGVSQVQETLRAALALGADRALLIETPAQIDPEPLAVAKLLARVAAEHAIDLVVCGKQAIDNDMNATGQMLAALLGWPQATNAYSIVLEGQTLTVTRETDAGLQTLELTLPAVVTADLRLNQPRFASLPNIMRARSKPLAVRSSADFGVDMSPRLQVLKTVAPPPRPSAAYRVRSPAELVVHLRKLGVLR